MFSTVLLALSGARALIMMIGLSLLSWWPLFLVVGGLALWAWGLHVTRQEKAVPVNEPVNEPVHEPVPVQVPAPRVPRLLVPRQRGVASRSRNISSGSVNPNPR